MAKKVIIGETMNPFNKSKPAADMFFSDKKDTNITNVDKDNIVVTVEQQNQQIQNNQQEENNTTSTTRKAKTPKREFPGKQHVHLILPDNQADAIKRLAKSTGLSINQLMQQVIDQHMKEWQPILDQFDQTQRKLGLISKPVTKKLLGE